ncbi:MAG TPA: glycosyltransferase, partial [Candidatus Paceibacterota bacterium]|nr:glycosyltransferase [Candidatus Paceibacterota bacterium]
MVGKESLRLKAQKIIICSPQLGISPESNLGGEVYDREIINEMCNQGVKVITILPKKKPFIPHKNLKVYYLPFSHIWPPYLFNLFIIPWLFWLYKKEKFKILRVHSPYFIGIGAFIFRFFYSQVPLVANYYHLEENICLFHLINKLLIKKWNLIMTISQFSKKDIIKKYKIKPSKIKVSYCGINSRLRFKKKNKTLINKYGAKGKKILLFLGNLSRRKNISFLLKLAGVLKDRDYHLLIGGKGKLLKRLLRQRRELGIKNKVTFTGFIPEKE